jgi:hypothetical protein
MSRISMPEKFRNDVETDLGDFWLKSRSSQEDFGASFRRNQESGQDAAGFFPGMFWSVSRRHPDGFEERSQKRARTRGKRAGRVPGAARERSGADSRE